MLGWAHQALTRLNLNGHVSERNMTLDVVTLSVKGHTVLVVLSLMHVLFLGSEQSTVITTRMGASQVWLMSPWTW